MTRSSSLSASPAARARSTSAIRSPIGTGSGSTPCPNGSLPRHSRAETPRASSSQARLSSSVAAASPSVTSWSTTAGSGIDRKAPGVAAMIQASLRQSRARSAPPAGSARAPASAWAHQAVASSP